MRALVFTHCLPKRKTKQFEAIDIVLPAELPFIPQQGNMLKLTANGEFLLVDQVFWDATKPDEIHVFIKEEDDLPTWKEMSAEGWVES